MLADKKFSQTFSRKLLLYLLGRYASSKYLQLLQIIIVIRDRHNMIIVSICQVI
jgi:hypothetical protein